MAALHEALKTLGPADFSDTPLEDLNSFLSSAFRQGELIVDSVPLAPPTSGESAQSEGRSRASSTSASDILLSAARPEPPADDVVALQKEWKGVKLNAKENPLGMSVYKLSAKDGRGAWFARRSVHEGLGFKKWKKALEREFPETMKVQGGPGEGNIRGIGGERRVEYKNVPGVGKMEVYQLSAQFPGPTTPRDFVTMFLTSDSALSNKSAEENDVPRHFMVISKPCVHPDTAPREGYIRGQYESVEFIREIPRTKKKSASTSTTQTHTRNRSSTEGKNTLKSAFKTSSTNTSETEIDARKLSASTSDLPAVRSRGKTISFDTPESHDEKGTTASPDEDDDDEFNPVEWIMITRSDPGGSVPRFMVERGTPGGIVSDASKFLDWACAKDIEDFESDDELETGEESSENAHKHHHEHNHEHDLHNYQTNGHLAGLEEEEDPKIQGVETDATKEPESQNTTTSGSGLYGMVGTAGAIIASHTPAIISNYLPLSTVSAQDDSTARRDSLSSISSDSSFKSFASALSHNADDSSFKTSDSSPDKLSSSLQDKDLQKLESRKRKLDEKLRKSKERESSSTSATSKEDALRKAEEKHQRETRKQEEKYAREVSKLTRKREKEARKIEERKRKAADKDERSRLLRELDEARAEAAQLKKEREMLRGQVGDLQAENTSLAAKVGRLGIQGEGVLREVREEVGKTGRLRASSLKGLRRSGSFKSGVIVGPETNGNGNGPPIPSFRNI